MIISFFPDVPLLAALALWVVFALALCGGAHALFWLFLGLHALCFPARGRAVPSPDGKYYAQVTHGGIDVRSVRSQKRISRVCDAQPLREVIWSPDGACLATVSDMGVMQVWNAWTSRLLFRSTVLVGQGASVAWSPDAKHLALVGADQGLRIWDVLSWKCIYRSLLSHLSETEGPCLVRCMAWSPTGRFLASAEKGGMVRVWDRDNGDLCAWQDDDGKDVTTLAFSEGAPYLLMSNEAGKVSALHVTRGREAFWTYQHHCPVETVYWGRGQYLGDVFVKDVDGSWLRWNCLEVLAPLYQG